MTTCIHEMFSQYSTCSVNFYVGCSHASSGSLSLVNTAEQYDVITINVFPLLFLSPGYGVRFSDFFHSCRICSYLPFNVSTYYVTRYGFLFVIVFHVSITSFPRRIIGLNMVMATLRFAYASSTNGRHVERNLW